MATQDFNIETFTDVILTYLDESGEEERQIQCHKAILCAKSTYFREQLEAADSMEVDGRSLLELELNNLNDVDVEDFEAMIQYLYTSQLPAPAEDNDWERWLSRARIANKYGIPEMEDEALKTFEAIFKEVPSECMLRKLTVWHLYDYGSDKLKSIVEPIRQRYIKQLVRDPEYALATDDKEVMKQCLRHMNMQQKLQLKCVYCGECRAARSPFQKPCTNFANHSKENHKWVEDKATASHE